MLISAGPQQRVQGHGDRFDCPGDLGRLGSMSAKEEVFTIPARRCKRCGGLLTSSQGLRDGYGPCCLRKMRQEEADRKMMENQCSLFDIVPKAEQREEN